MNNLIQELKSKHLFDAVGYVERRKVDDEIAYVLKKIRCEKCGDSIGKMVYFNSDRINQEFYCFECAKVLQKGKRQLRMKEYKRKSEK